MARTRKRPDPVEMTLTIESLSNDARGVAHHDGKTVFVDGALPGEVVRCQTVRRRSKYDSAEIVEVLQASPDRVEPRCAAYGVCGGCSLQHMAESMQIVAKQQVLLDNFRHIAKVEPVSLLPALTDRNWNYRRKARLGVRVVPKKGGVLVGFREKHSSYIALMENCKILDDRFANLLMSLRKLVGRLSIANRVPQIELAAGDDNAALIFRHLQPLTDEDLQQLRLFGQQHGLQILLQPKGPDTIHALPRDEMRLLSYQLTDWGVEIRFRATDFTQVNAGINQKMIARALQLLAPQKDEKILDLFCGVGNFSLPLARQGNHVTGIEGDRMLVNMARENAMHNGLENAKFITADLYDVPLDGSWLHEKWQRILLDPPRSGALEVVKRLPELEPERIVYVSCNPATLARDAEVLVHHFGYRLREAGVMDMFPHTTHVESMAVFDAP